MFELGDGSCFPKVLLVVNVALACTDGSIALLAFYQLIRIHLRNSQLGWTRQKVFHLLIASSNMGYFVYFVSTLVAACKSWPCWSHSCGFIIMACPEILFLAAFLLLLSFWVDLCHQSNDEDDEAEENSPREALLERISNKLPIKAVRQIRCCSLRAFNVGSRQKVVILVTLLLFVSMMASSVLIWIGMGKNPIDSSVVAQVYVDFFAVSIFLLGGALACYGLVLFMKMRNVRSERASSEMWKVAVLAIVSVLCFTIRASVALFTYITVPYHWRWQQLNGIYTAVLLILYYLLGSSVPSLFVLWMMRELPPSVVTKAQEESRMIAFIADRSVTVHSQRWTTAMSSQNQVLKASPI